LVEDRRLCNRACPRGGLCRRRSRCLPCDREHGWRTAPRAGSLIILFACDLDAALAAVLRLHLTVYLSLYVKQGAFALAIVLAYLYVLPSINVGVYRPTVWPLARYASGAGVRGVDDADSRLGAVARLVGRLGRRRFPDFAPFRRPRPLGVGRCGCRPALCRRLCPVRGWLFNEPTGLILLTLPWIVGLQFLISRRLQTLAGH